MRDITTISGSALEAEIARAGIVRSKLLNETIAAGMGAMKHSEIVETSKGSWLIANAELARRYLAACADLGAAQEELATRMRYHGRNNPIK